MPDCIKHAREAFLGGPRLMGVYIAEVVEDGQVRVVITCIRWLPIRIPNRIGITLDDVPTRFSEFKNLIDAFSENNSQVKRLCKLSQKRRHTRVRIILFAVACVCGKEILNDLVKKWEIKSICSTCTSL
jgi:hypothetical protein